MFQHFLTNNYLSKTANLTYESNSEWENINLVEKANLFLSNYNNSYCNKNNLKSSLYCLYFIKPFIQYQNVSKYKLNSYKLPYLIQIEFMTSLHNTPLFYFKKNNLIQSK